MWLQEQIEGGDLAHMAMADLFGRLVRKRWKSAAAATDHESVHVPPALAPS